ncbi:MAG: glycosyltransferase family 2 protein, partial [Flavobacteriaceae bacterium]|nr:glycosyltransferase family 2 protein [Flavobacteriaceae bacterium]
MFVEVLKYLQPTHYFQKSTLTGRRVYPVYEELPSEVKSQLIPDEDFKSEHARCYDLSWQAIHKGYIGSSRTYKEFKTIPVSDNYVFARKYFSSVWVFYLLLMRISGLHNPFKELGAWLRTGRVKRSYTINEPLSDDGRVFESKLVRSEPMVSVIIPTLNRYEYLKDILIDLENQDYSNFEVIVVDQSEPFQKDFYQDYNLDLNLIRQEEKALWLARNTAIKKAKGELIALSEDDVRIKSDWIVEHLKCLDHY